MPYEVMNAHNRFSAEKRVERCPNCLNPSKLRRNDYRIVWPLYTTNVTPRLTSYTIEEVWTCVVCDKSALELCIFSFGIDQERPPDEVRTIYPIAPPRSRPPEATQ